MPRLSAIQNYQDTKRITIEYNGMELNFDVSPGSFTLGWSDRISKARTAQDITDTFFTLVKGWDITDDDDQVLPLDVTAVDQLAVPTFISLSQLITDKLLPNRPTRS